MRKNRILLFDALCLILLGAACAGPLTPTPSPVPPPTDVSMETETMEPTDGTATGTPTEGMPDGTGTPADETPTVVATDGTTTGTPSVQPTVVPVHFICWFCVRQIPHALLMVPANTTVEAASAASAIECNSVEDLEDQQLVLCRGPQATGMVSFDLNVCTNGNCTERQVTAIDCSGTPMPMTTTTTTPSVTVTVTMAMTQTATQLALTTTRTPAPGTGATQTQTVVPLTGTPLMMTGTPTVVTTTTPTP